MAENNNNIDNGDLLLEQFFQAARTEQLADCGFSRRVMMRLPERQERLSHIWTAACVVTALAVFTLIGGWQQAAAGVVRVLSSVPTTGQLLQLAFCGAVLTALAAAELMRREELTLR